MRTQSVTPNGIERTFRDDQVIVSKTDLQGRITYANDAFLAISGYTEKDVIGAPHNLIRHPAMPRSVFAFLWDTITAGNEIFAYVINLAADGAHYWVLAHVTPTFGAGGRIIGYHSNRRTARPQAVSKVSDFYAELRHEEQRHSNARDAVAAGTRLLTQRLTELGTTYEEFVWALDTELAAAS
jgi:PAS domain S-box-containing protein